MLFLGGGGTDLLSSRWSVEPLASDRFQVPEYDAPKNAYPRSVTQKEFDYSVYVFGPPAALPSRVLITARPARAASLTAHARRTSRKWLRRNTRGW